MEGAVGNADNILITTALLDLFSTPGAWEPSGSLPLDIGAHSSSDSEHWLKYLTFGPDTPSEECGGDRWVEQ